MALDKVFLPSDARMVMVMVGFVWKLRFSGVFTASSFPFTISNVFATDCSVMENVCVSPESSSAAVEEKKKNVKNV